MASENYQQIVDLFKKNKELILKHTLDRDTLAYEIEKLTYWREMELRKEGLFYKYEVNSNPDKLDFRFLSTRPKLDV